MNKSLKILLLATTVLKCGVVFGADDAAAAAGGDGVVAVYESPVRHNRQLVLPALNGFDFLNGGVALIDADAARALASQICEQREELAANLVAINGNSTALQRTAFAIPGTAMRAVAEYREALGRAHALSKEVQDELDEINRSAAPGKRKILGFQALLERETALANERSAALAQTKAALAGKKDKLLGNVDGAADALGVIFGEAQGDAPLPPQAAGVAGAADAHSPAHRSVSEARSGGDGEGDQEDF